MMKLIVFVFLALVAVAYAGVLGEGPEVYSAVTTKQVHSPWATSYSTRSQSFNDYTAIVPVVAPVVAPVAKVVAPVAKVLAPVSYDYGYDYGYGY